MSIDLPCLRLSLVLLHVRMGVGHAGRSTVGRRLCGRPSPRTHVVHAGHGCLRIGGHAVHVVGGRRWLVARILTLRLLLHARMWRPMTRVRTGRRTHRPWRRLWWSAACSIVSKVRVVSVEHVWCIAVHLNWGRRRRFCFSTGQSKVADALTRETNDKHIHLALETAPCCLCN